MMAVGPLMVEHRLIESVITLIGAEAAAMRKSGKVDVLFVERAVDFINFYADRSHHGRGILFKAIAQKPLKPEFIKIMQELTQQHVMARQAVVKIANAVEDYQHGQASALEVLAREMETLAIFYPRHIEHEEKKFFLGCMEYLNEAEMQSILQAYVVFDSQLLHEKYKELYVKLMRA